LLPFHHRTVINPQHVSFRRAGWNRRTRRLRLPKTSSALSTRSIWDADRGPGRCVSPRSCRKVTRGSKGAGVSNPPSRRVRPRMPSVRRESLRCVGRVRLGPEDRSRTRSWMRRRMPHIGATGWPRKPTESLVSVMKSPHVRNRYDPTLLRLFNCRALRRPRPNSEILFGRETRVTSLRTSAENLSTSVNGLGRQFFHAGAKRWSRYGVPDHSIPD
jgi:hypothetical protein